MDTILFTFLFLLAATVYFLPTVIAWQRDHDSMITIFFLNLLAAWTVIVWIALIIWAIATNITTPPAAARKTSNDNNDGLRIKCPFCTEPIPTQALFCQHCGKEFFPHE